MSPVSWSSRSVRGSYHEFARAKSSGLCCRRGKRLFYLAERLSRIARAKEQSKRLRSLHRMRDDAADKGADLKAGDGVDGCASAIAKEPRIGAKKFQFTVLTGRI